MQFFLRKSLKLAAYVCANGAEICSEYRHYALNFAEYTHFTSPIRRYADVLVHRLLQHALSSVGKLLLISYIGDILSSTTLC
jgi:exoribonuclease R